MRILSEPGDLAKVLGHPHSAACSFVPTMGALHEGHLALARRAAELFRPVVMSIFVNPTQFAPGEDFDRYPRTLDADAALAKQAGVDIIFTPTVQGVYPQGPSAGLGIRAVPSVAHAPGLEEAFRPGHFGGVCQVVARLFDLVRPAVAVFGEKDYQQLRVIEQLVEQEYPRWGEMRIERLETVREPSGLAMSSRNRYMTEPQREQALGLSKALYAAQRASGPYEAEAVMDAILKSHGLRVDYAVVRDATTLQPMTTRSGSARALIAARLETVRLIDNMAIRFSDR
ncbi:MAG TPA: pantoate--beta-alanine ligase [Phycisphaerales bacterium]|nr:pantoate--beta-alanine ligase [Phycisphaerales bacterium]